jgi:hypothetical protein
MSKMRLRNGPGATAGRTIVGFAAIALAAALCACGPTIANMPLIGEPSRTPARPDVRPDFPAVSEPMTHRTTTPLTAAERAKVEADLIKDRTQAAQEMRQQINEDRGR